MPHILKTLAAITVIALVASCAAPAGSAGHSSPNVSGGTVFKEHATTVSANVSQSRVAAVDKPWRRATDYSQINDSDTQWVVDPAGNKALIDQYDAEQNYNRAAEITNAPASATGGGIIFYVRDVETQQQVAVTYSGNVASFATQVGKNYTAYVELYLDGADGTEIDCQAVSQDFVSTGNDVFEFALSDQGCDLTVNGVDMHAIYNWWPENPTLPYAGSYNTICQNSEARSAQRKRNFELYGGYGYVAEFLMP